MFPSFPDLVMLVRNSFAVSGKGLSLYKPQTTKLSKSFPWFDDREHLFIDEQQHRQSRTFEERDLLGSYKQNENEPKSRYTFL